MNLNIFFGVSPSHIVHFRMWEWQTKSYSIGNQDTQKITREQEQLKPLILVCKDVKSVKFIDKKAINNNHLQKIYLIDVVLLLDITFYTWIEIAFFKSKFRLFIIFREGQLFTILLYKSIFMEQKQRYSAALSVWLTLSQKIKSKMLFMVQIISNSYYLQELQSFYCEIKLMLRKDDCESIIFEAIRLQANSLFQQKSPICFLQQSALQEDANRVVKIESQTLTNLETQSKSDPPPKSRRMKKTWRQQEQLEYFCAVIIFSYSNPYLTLSWEWWKPRRFYVFLQSHMQAVFGVGYCRDHRQCKTKDQNFKIQYYQQSTTPMDLVDLALSRLVAFVNKKKRVSKGTASLDPITLNRTKRFEEALTKYKLFVAGLSKASAYQIELQRLMTFQHSLHTQIVQLWKKAI